MSGFLNYLDEFETKSEKVIKTPKKVSNVTKTPKKVTESKVEKNIQTTLNDKIKDLSKDELNIFEEAVDKILAKRNGTTIKKPYRIKPKKVKKDVVEEAVDHATDILDDLPDAPSSFDVRIAENQEYNPTEPTQIPIEELNLEDVGDHASALL